MPPKLRSKTILESQNSVSDVAEAAHEEFILAMVEQFEKKIANFLQEEFASNSPFRQEVVINMLARQRFDENMAA